MLSNDTATVNTDDNTQTTTETAPKKTATKRRTKLEIAAEKLPSMNEIVTESFNELSAKLESNDLDALAAHLAFESRRRRLEASLSNTVEVGKVVRVVSGPLDLVGKTGVVTESKRVRCYVEIDGDRVYLFHSDVELVDGETVTVNVPANDSNDVEAVAS